MGFDPVLVDFDRQSLATEAARKELSHLDYLAQLAEGEASLRQDRAVARRIKAARFPLIKTLDSFRWDWPKKINRLNERYRASGLNLVVAAIALWNTVYLERAADELARSRAVDFALFQHVSPLGWEHINLTGDYTWHTNRRVAKGGFRPLRTAKKIFSAP